MASTKEDILEGIKQLSVLDVSWLVKELESTFGVSAAAPVAVAVAPAAGAAAAVPAAEEEEKTEFNVVLKEVGPNKINVIKTVRELTSLGLKESKELVDSAPATVRESVTKEEADSMVAKLREAGATADMA